jgi:hypothetical protein
MVAICYKMEIARRQELKKFGPACWRRWEIPNLRGVHQEAAYGLAGGETL